MSNMRNIRGFAFLPLLVIVLALSVGGGVYYYFDQQNGPANEDVKMVDENGRVLGVNTTVELAKLDNLRNRFAREQKSIDSLRQEYARMIEKIIVPTDALFLASQGLNPAIKMTFVDSLRREEISLKRRQISEVLARWKARLAIIADDDELISPLTLSGLIANAENDSNLVRSYVRDLDELVKELSTANSGLTAAQINSYQSLVSNAFAEAAQALAVIAQIQLTAAESVVVEIDDSETDDTDMVEDANLVTEPQIKAQEKVVAASMGDSTPAPVEEDDSTIETVPITPASEESSGIDNVRIPPRIPELIEGANRN